MRIAISGAICFLLAVSAAAAPRTAIAATRAVAPAADALKADFYDAVRRKAYAQANLIARRYLLLNPNDDPLRLDDAYVLLDLGQTTEATVSFRVLSSSKNPTVATAARKQLADLLLQAAYDASGKGDHVAAMASLKEYLTIKPDDDQARLQLAYELNALGRNDEARQEFAKLTASPTADIAKKAGAAVANLSPVSHTAYVAPPGSLYGYVIHDNRFADTFYGADLRYDLNAARVVPYLIAHLSSDTRSGAPGAAEIFNDDALVLGAGVRTAVSKRVSAFAEAGSSIGLRGKESFPEVRYGVTYYAEFGSINAAHTTIEGSAVEYSRFTNFIFYGSLTHDFPVHGPLRAVVGLNGALDAHRFYYNNYAEAYLGLQLRLGKPVTLRLIHAYGTYLDRGIGAPQRSYESTRAEALFGISFK